ncbi:SUMF1/EgtB/PvdO family nonheme iron enzyme [Acinetobacter sp. P1(2025)]|uniref:SUMF1/EgtB/PvdO family nonheme iron enzyme n=1 Tax=Acinetobacter sp. P1(2025) TaxID=3446120 RepID=UPI003F53535D
MAKQTINQGTAPTGAGGDTFRSGSAKLQANDNELYTHLGAADGTLTIDKTRTALGIDTDKTNLTILVKDSLRQSVELASGGEQTVLYTAKGQPTYMNIIQKYDMSTIDASLSGTHPAFIVDGVEKPEIFVGTYQGRLVNGELLSLPNVDPSHSTNYDNFLTYARACGAGHHLITNAEWSAIALSCYKNDTQPFGNTYYGRSSENPLLIGRRQDGLDLGNTAGAARTLTGSGPVEWRHNRKPSGIADLSGNVWEWNSGMRIFNGEIQVIADNNAALHTIDMSATSAQWKAIDAVTGNLVTPDGNGTTVGTVKYANGGTADYTINGASFGAIRNLSTTNPVSAAALARLKALCLYPHTENTASYNSDYFGKSMTGETLPIRGGGWNNAASAGVFALGLSYVRTGANTIFGARPAFVSL